MYHITSCWLGLWRFNTDHGFCICAAHAPARDSLAGGHASSADNGKTFQMQINHFPPMTAWTTTRNKTLTAAFIALNCILHPQRKRTNSYFSILIHIYSLIDREYSQISGMNEIKGRSNQPSFLSQSQIKAMAIASRVLDGFKSIKGSPNELYKAYLLKFLDSFSYFSFSLIFTIFLSDDFGYSDLTAGTLYGVWGALVTAFGLLTGVIVDNLGGAFSLVISLYIL